MERPDQQRTRSASKTRVNALVRTAQHPGRGVRIPAYPVMTSVFCQFPNPCAITLRMTLGSASSFNVAIGTKRMPDGARVPAGTRAV